MGDVDVFLFLFLFFCLQLKIWIWILLKGWTHISYHIDNILTKYTDGGENWIGKAKVAAISFWDRL